MFEIKELCSTVRYGTSFKSVMSDFNTRMVKVLALLSRPAMPSYLNNYINFYVCLPIHGFSVHSWFSVSEN